VSDPQLERPQQQRPGHESRPRNDGERDGYHDPVPSVHPDDLRAPRMYSRLSPNSGIDADQDVARRGRLPSQAKVRLGSKADMRGEGALSAHVRF
jgi:hypothetical protein